MSRPSDDVLPWWILVAVAVVLTNLASNPDHQTPLDAPGNQEWQSSQGRHRNLRRLGDAVQPLPFEVLPPAGGHRSPTVSLNVPCWLMIAPCGNVTIPSNGTIFQYPLGLGAYHVPGTGSLSKSVSHFDHAFSHFTAMAVLVLLAVYVVFKCCQRSTRSKAVKKWHKLQDGSLDSDSEDDRPRDDPERQKDEEEELRERLDPQSQNFIAPGNIYRLLAIMHPGVIGWKQWFHFTFKAMVCGYMQMWLPYKILAGTLHSWHVTGVKSPIWFVENAFAFASMVASLGSLTFIFQGKCAETIRVGAEANYYILTHYSNSRPAGSPLGICLNETFWCWLSMSLNIAMSIMLQLCMFVKIATFTGAIDHVAMVCVSLYLIFDLDGKVMEGDPKLRLKYRRGVARMSKELPDDDPKRTPAKWLLRTAAGWIAVSNFLAPLMLLGLILVAWHNPKLNIYIGGSGLEGLHPAQQVDLGGLTV